MNKLHAIILLVIIIGLIYWLTTKTSATIKNNVEYFNMLKGIDFLSNEWNTESEIISDNNTFKSNKTLQSNNIPKPKKYRKVKSWNKENFYKDNFINVQGNMVRRELVPSNYANTKFASAYDYGLFLQNNRIAPQPNNYYF